jgi:hypothetical protein
MQLQAAGYGLVSFNQNNGDFLYTTYKVKKNDTVIVQFPDANGVSVCCRKLEINKHRLKQVAIPVSDELFGKPVYVYQVKGIKNIGDALPFIGIASIGMSVRINQITPNFLEVSQKHQRITLKTCISSEGLHLNGFNGTKKIYELYYSFGYEVESPTCK